MNRDVLFFAAISGLYQTVRAHELLELSAATAQWLAPGILLVKEVHTRQEPPTHVVFFDNDRWQWNPAASCPTPDIHTIGEPRHNVRMVEYWTRPDSPDPDNVHEHFVVRSGKSTWYRVPRNAGRLDRPSHPMA